MPTALIADDEPRLLDDLAQRLQQLWPQLQIVTRTSNGIAAVAALLEHEPDFAFLDIRMPGLDGLQVAKTANDTRIVFVTAFDEYAISAFEAAAIDYLLKPVSDVRLAQCVARLQQSGKVKVDLTALSTLLTKPIAAQLEWLTVRLGETTRLIPVNEVLYFQSADKYTEVVTQSERHLIRTPLKELLTQLDTQRFAQIHRSVIVSLAAIDRIDRDMMGRTLLHLKGHATTLVISRSFADRFRQL